MGKQVLMKALDPLVLIVGIDLGSIEDQAAQVVPTDGADFLGEAGVNTLEFCISNILIADCL
tara:strand:+ start:102 stop:287 length:186 start_codon:yes stop_codon:yes gene_type:complete